MANLSFYAQEIDDILGRADKATAATALTSADTLAGLGDGLYTATAEVASAISDSPVSVAFTLRVLADMYILILADGSDTYTGAPGSWHKSSIGEDTTARAAIAEHIADKNNPHEVTKVQIGLGNVDNVSTKDVLAELVDSGAKNLIQNAATSRTENGVTFTVNADGTVSLNGTASATIWFPIMTNMTINSGTYTISNGLADDTARVIISTTNSLSSRIFDSNESGYITKTIDSISGVNAYLRVASGKVTDGTVVKPMLCTKAAWDISQEYVPYRPSYDELVARIEALESGGN